MADASGAVADGPLRWIPPDCRSGAWQMAIDEMLLDASLAAPERARPVLRLYRWSRPTLSLGHHQQRLPPHWSGLAKAGRIDLVRRPSGGRAVLHGGDLTYALVLPRPARSRAEAYRQACRWLQEAFAGLGCPLVFGDHRPSAEAASCFALATAADLVHADGTKRIGSAQLWRRGHLLQHGSIQLAPSPALWQRLFAAPPPSLPALPIGDNALIAHLAGAAADQWGGRRLEPLTAAELELAAARLERYRLASGTTPASAAETSPVPTMPRAT